MGWDAFSSAPLSINKGLKLKHKRHREAFAQAVANVRKHTDMVDGYLDAGALDCSACRDMLEKAAEKSVKNLNWGLAYEPGGMQPEVVKVMHMFLNWDFRVKKDDIWAYWSAREFVRVCVEQDLAIRFDC